MASGERSLAFCHDSHWTIQVASTGNIINILDPEEYILSWWPPTTSNGVTRDNIHISCFFLHFNKNCQQCFSNIQSYPKFCNQFPSFWNPRIADLNQPTCVRLNYQLGLFYHWSNFWGSIVGIPAAQCKLISHQSSKKTLQFFCQVLVLREPSSVYNGTC